MADKNDILEEQRRAREEFLKLKKMQQGELDAGPKPSEVAIVPKTFKEKWDNFWFQYKWHTIGITAALIVLTVLVAQCATKPKYDMSVVYFSYTPVMDNQLNKVSDYIEEFASDLDGNGEVNISVVNCSLSNESNNVQYRNTVLTKLQALIAADEKALIFITDNESIEYFENISPDGGFFDAEPLKLGDAFYNSTTNSSLGKLPDGLQISCRKVSDTILGEKKDIKKYYEESNKVLEGIKKDNNSSLK